MRRATKGVRFTAIYSRRGALHALLPCFLSAEPFDRPARTPVVAFRVPFLLIFPVDLQPIAVRLPAHKFDLRHRSLNSENIFATRCFFILS